MEVKQLQTIEGFILLLLIALEVFVLTKYWSIGLGFALLCILAMSLLVYISLVLNLHFIIRRLRNILLNQMDPEKLRREMDQYFQSEKQRGSSLFYLFESARYDLLGDYRQALESSMKKSFNQPRMQRAVKAGLCYYYARLGDLTSAESYLPFCEELLKSAKGRVKAATLHTLGCYHLVKGEFAASRRCFEDAVQMDQSGLTLLNLYFDLACLEDAQGNPEKANAYFRQAADLGPKTFLGQEAARRLYSRGIRVSDSLVSDYLLRQSGNP